MLFSEPCKSGQLQIDETTVRMLSAFKKQIWLVPRDAVTYIGLKKGAMMMTDLTIYTVQYTFSANFMAPQKAEQFLTFFPNVQVGVPLPPGVQPQPQAPTSLQQPQQVPMIPQGAQQIQQYPQTQIATPLQKVTPPIPRKKSWYHDPTRLTYIATYTNEKEMQKEVEAAAQFGWLPQGTTATGSHINVGRTMTKFVLTGGIGMMTGASRSKDKITITFLRTPEWMAQNH